MLVRFDLAHNQSKTVTDTDEIAWPLALDARTGRILAVVDGQYVILSSEDGDVIERLDLQRRAAHVIVRDVVEGKKGRGREGERGGLGD